MVVSGHLVTVVTLYNVQETSQSLVTGAPKEETGGEQSNGTADRETPAEVQGSGSE